MSRLEKEAFLAQMQPDLDLADLREPCPICYEPMKDAIRTECQHVFCLECLKPWVEDSHTCPSCRGELYEKPEDEEDEDYVYPYGDYAWSRFDSVYNEAAVREMLQNLQHNDILEAGPHCALLSNHAFIDYEDLLNTAVVRIVDSLQYTTRRLTGMTHAVYAEGGEMVGNAIQAVLARLRNQTIRGANLFLAMECEVYRRLRLPTSAALWSRRFSGENFSPGYCTFEIVVTDLLRRVVQAGLAANTEQVVGPYSPYSDRRLPDYSGPHYLYFVHPEDVIIARQQLSPPSGAVPGSTEVYVSRTLLLPTLIASFHEQLAFETLVLRQDHDDHLHGMFADAIAHALPFLDTILMLKNGDAMSKSELLDILISAGPGGFFRHPLAKETKGRQDWLLLFADFLCNLDSLVKQIVHAARLLNLDRLAMATKESVPDDIGI